MFDGKPNTKELKLTLHNKYTIFVKCYNGDTISEFEIVPNN